MQSAKLPPSPEIQGHNPAQVAKAQPEDSKIEKPLEKTPSAEEILSPDDVSKLLEG
jgi:hypothetical protein